MSKTRSPQISPVTGRSLHRRGLTGRGVGIAVIDSGVTAPDEFGDRLVIGPDLTADFGTEAHGLDRTGHGTHLAGIAAGEHTGVAPGAHIVSIKAAGKGGETDPMAVVAAIDWAVDNRRILQLGVVLLAFGADQLDGRDPLAEAVTRAWRAGMVVVTSAGNEGEAPLPTPAHIDDVLTVGAGELVDGTWQRCDFSNTGRRGERADLLAPGRSLVGPVARGSDSADAPATSFVGAEHVKGSGSSQAAAVAAGAAALLLEADPGLTPDEVKRLLCTSAIRVDDPAAGAGALDLELALAALASGLFHEPSITAFRPGEWSGQDWRGLEWSGQNWRGQNWRGQNWRGQNWRGQNWRGQNWRGQNWRGQNWRGQNWRGQNWRGLEWSGQNWRGQNWRGLEWSGQNWRGQNWRGQNWRGQNWRGQNWRGQNWRGQNWRGLEWSGQNWRGQNWRGLEWSGQNWRGQNWRGQNWRGQNWRGLEWSGQNWRGQNWRGQNWRGQNWRGQNWRGQNWRGQNWRGLEWSGQNWR